MRAIEAATKFVELSGGTGWALLELAYVHARAGNRTEADKIVADVTAGGNPYSPYDMATICSAYGDLAGALHWLAEAITQRSVDVIWVRVDPRLENVRADSAFQDLLRRMAPAQ
jgi:hypothetical protein